MTAGEASPGQARSGGRGLLDIASERAAGIEGCAHAANEFVDVAPFPARVEEAAARER
jgi:hypothetical protein